MTNRSRRGSLLVVVMGMIILMLGLTIGLASKVSNSIKGNVIIQRQAQAHIMMLAAKMIIKRADSGIGDSCALPAGVTLASGLTAGDGGSNGNLDSSLGFGWVHIKETGVAQEYYVIAGGGGSGIDPTHPTDRTGWKSRVTFLPGTARNELITRSIYDQVFVYKIKLLGIGADKFQIDVQPLDTTALPW